MRQWLWQVWCDVRFTVRLWWYMLKAKAKFKAAWLLPRWLVYFAVIRLWAEASTGKYSSTELTKITVDQALDAWEGKV